MPVSPVQESSAPKKPKKVLNRFNFCEQGIQNLFFVEQSASFLLPYAMTKDSPVQDVTILTDPMPNRKFVGLANQRIIYQEYAADFAKQVG